jgi:hypothetical protein
MKGLAICFVLVTAVAMSAAEKASIPRTSDGHPDLQGTWSYATLTTLERPAEFKDKPVLTVAEAAAFEQRTLKIQDRDRRDVDTSTGRGSDGRTTAPTTRRGGSSDRRSSALGGPRSSSIRPTA